MDEPFEISDLLSEARLRQLDAVKGYLIEGYPIDEACRLANVPNRFDPEEMELICR